MMSVAVEQHRRHNNGTLVSINHQTVGAVFLADIADFAAFNEVYARYFTSKPARSCVAVKDLPKGVLCEIEAVAEA